jgi:putative FmdB family regulatory protein
MPTYDFACNDCSEEFTELTPFDSSGAYSGVHCPKCGSSHKTKVFGSFCFSFSNPEGTDRWSSDSHGHDYRFKHNLPKVVAERAAAEMASHMGGSPYNEIDDITSGEHFGDIK